MLERLFATQIILGGKIDSLFVLVEILATRQGVTIIDGLPLREWFEDNRRLQMLDALIKLGDQLGDPGFAARVTENIKSLQ